MEGSGRLPQLLLLLVLLLRTSVIRDATAATNWPVPLSSCCPLRLYSLRLPPPAPAPHPPAGAEVPTSVVFSGKAAAGEAGIGGAAVKLDMIRRTPLIMFGSVRRRSTVMVGGTREPSAQTRELTKSELQRLEEPRHDPFGDLKRRFLSFKKQNYVENPVQFHNLAQAQAPKFMVIACADSRACPSNVLGFQPGEAFTVRNVANLVPPFQHGPSETTAALEFAVNSLEVGNILVVGHSRCGGIQALMSLQEEVDSRSFIKEWVSIAMNARLSTNAAAGNQSFEMQCKHCEKESLNGSLLNLLSYPWIERRVIEGKLAIHGGYYDFVDGTFEKWTLVYRQNMEGGNKFELRDRDLWS